MPVLSVVVPTYNEAGHIQEFLQALADACRDLDYEILVVDDDSPDKTHDRVEAEARKNPRIVPILRTQERGLATAVIEGIRRARGTYVAVMDSDFQHPPEAVPRLLEAAQRAEADLVVGSRYVQGGSVGDFSATRRIISWGAKTLAVLALTRVRRFGLTDPMSGFFLVRRAAVAPDALRPRGYKILVEILARADIQRATEVGYGFGGRRGGESKLRLKTQWDYFWHVLGLGLRDRENLRLILFALVGLSGIAINVGAYYVLTHAFEWKTALLLSIPAAIAREISILWNFVWNDHLTFRDIRNEAHAGFLRRALRFNVVSLVSFAAYLGLFVLLIKLGVHEYVSLLVAIFLTFLLNYRGNRRWTYAAAKPPTPAKEGAA